MGLIPRVRLMVVGPAPAERRRLCALAQAAGFRAQHADSLDELARWLAYLPAPDEAGCVLATLAQACDAVAACQLAVGRPPVIVLRDEPDAEVLLAAWSAGAAGFVPGHPLSVELLRSAVERATGRRACPDGPDLRVPGPSPLRVLQVTCHDLRNPLTAMTMNANILLREASVDDQRRAKVASRILASANRMSRMLEDFADYALAAQGKPLSLRPGEIDLGTLVSESLVEARAAHPHRSLVLEQRGDLRGHWDASRIRQLLHHLLASSLRRGHPQATVVVACAEHSSAAEVEIAVDYRLPSDVASGRAEAKDGEGSRSPDDEDAKLFVAGRIADAHRGSLTVSTDAPVGPCFLVRLPKRALVPTTAEDRAV